jgi:hypothetical protein
MLTMVEACFPKDVAAATLEEGATVVAMAMVTSPTSLGMSFLHASYVARLIT